MCWSPAAELISPAPSSSAARSPAARTMFSRRRSSSARRSARSMVMTVPFWADARRCSASSRVSPTISTTLSRETRRRRCARPAGESRARSRAGSPPMRWRGHARGRGDAKLPGITVAPDDGRAAGAGRDPKVQADGAGLHVPRIDVLPGELPEFLRLGRSGRRRHGDRGGLRAARLDRPAGMVLGRGRGDRG